MIRQLLCYCLTLGFICAGASGDSMARPASEQKLPWLVKTSPTKDNTMKTIPFISAGYERYATTISNDNLENIRGGFMTSNGMLIDIGLFSQTILNGVIIDEHSIDKKDLASINTQELQRIIKVNETGGSVSTLQLSDTPQLLTVIQNSQNNAMINNATILNIDVSNTNRFLFQVQMPLINHQIINGL